MKITYGCPIEILPTLARNLSIAVSSCLPSLPLAPLTGAIASNAGKSTIVYTMPRSTPMPAKIPTSAMGATSDVEKENSPAAVVAAVITTASPECPLE